jgi:hypothetical protein
LLTVTFTSSNPQAGPSVRDTASTPGAEPSSSLHPEIINVTSNPKMRDEVGLLNFIIIITYG